jgi:imidazolonepropionase
MTQTCPNYIGELVTNDPSLGDGDLGIIHDAAVVVDDGVVSWVGSRTALPATDTAPSDLAGRSIIPGFVDSHAHLVFAGERSAEFAARMAGEPYTGGGIRTTMAATRAASDDVLRANVGRLVREMASSGITTIEIKSGYGLDVETESRSLRIAREFTDETTFLGAHVVPSDFADRADEYVDLVCGEMLEACAPYAKWIDVFCERGAFDVEQSRRVLQAGIAKGLLPRIHANQLTSSLAVALAVEVEAAAADHLTYLSDEDIDLLASSNTVATLLPGVEFSTRSPYPRARDLIEAGAKVAIATDCNPGSCYSNSMPFMIALAVREMRMTPAEALRAATLGGASALRRTDVGKLSIGARADIVSLNAPSYIHLAYRPGVQIVDQVWSAGKAI